MFPDGSYRYQYLVGRTRSPPTRPGRWPPRGPCVIPELHTGTVEFRAEAARSIPTTPLPTHQQDGALDGWPRPRRAQPGFSPTHHARFRVCRPSRLRVLRPRPSTCTATKGRSRRVVVTGRLAPSVAPPADTVTPWRNRRKARHRLHRDAAARPRHDQYRLLTTEGVSTRSRRRRARSSVAPEAITRLTAEAMHDIAHFLRPATCSSCATSSTTPRPAQRPLRRPRPAEERGDRRRRRAADVPGHRHRDREGEEGPVRVHRRRRRGRDRRRRAGHVPHVQPALQPDGAADDVRRGQHRHQPARRDQDLRHRRRRVQVPVHRQGRRQRQQELPVPGDQGPAQRGRRCCRGCSRRCRRSAPRRARRTTSPS